MVKKGNTRRQKATKSASPCLSLHVEPADDKRRNVDAEEFFALGERWLKSLKAFASDTGQQVRWEIVELKKASAFVQVRPIEARSRKPLPSLVRNWERGFAKFNRLVVPREDLLQHLCKACVISSVRCQQTVRFHLATEETEVSHFL